MAKPRFKLEWYAKDVMRELGNITSAEEKESAKRVLQRAKKFVPVGKKTILRAQVRKPWQSRTPGRLKRSLRLYKSKYPDGGYTIFAGDPDLTYYAFWVEYGTVFTRKRKGERFMKRALTAEKSLFVRKLRKKLGV